MQDRQHKILLESNILLTSITTKIPSTLNYPQGTTSSLHPLSTSTASTIPIGPTANSFRCREPCRRQKATEGLWPSLEPGREPARCPEPCREPEPEREPGRAERRARGAATAGRASAEAGERLVDWKGEGEWRKERGGGERRKEGRREDGEGVTVENRLGI